MHDNIDANPPADQLIDFGCDVRTNIIKVLGVGGGGGNAVNHMFKYGIKDVDFIVANTDNQALEISEVPVKIRLGQTLTEGLGAGNNPERGRNAALESHNELCQALGIPPDGNITGPLPTKMLFVTAGMGGGTGTGAAPVITKIAKDAGILTVAIVTLPFRFEGPKRVNQAIEGLKDLADNVDSLLVVDNELVLKHYGDEAVDDAFAAADDVLTKAAKGIAEIITTRGHVNVDFADVNTVLKDSGIALMGTGYGEGENRAIKCIEAALNSPLLSNNNITGAKNMLINVMSSKDHKLTMNELNRINRYVQKAAGKRADLIWGKSEDNTLGDRLSVTLVVSGFKSSKIVNPFDDDNSDFFEDDDSLGQIIITDDGQTDADNEEVASETADETPAQTDAETGNDVAEEPQADEQAHQSGDEVDLGDVDQSLYDDEATADDEEEDRVIEPSGNFKPIDFASLSNMDSYDRIPAYQRKGLQLNINNYDPKYKRTPLNEA